MSRATAVVLIIQLVFGLLTLGFGVMALRVAPHPDRSVRRNSWYLTGATFATVGGLASICFTLAIPAVLAGRGTPLYEISSRLNPIGNDARGFAVFGFALALVHMMALSRPAPTRNQVVVGLAVLLLIGGTLGVLEGEYEPVKRYGVMSMIGVATVIALFVALYSALVHASMDWHLWAALAIYSVREAINSLTEAARSLGFAAENWRPPAVTLLWIGSLSVIVMIACTMIRLGWTRGMEPPALLERLRG